MSEVFTADEIKKALECHADEDIETCNFCPLLNVEGCAYKLAEFSLDLINRYEADIERYKGVIKLLEKDVAEAKVEAYKEFAEMLKQYVESNQVQTTFFGDKCFIDKDTIDNFVKERVGDDNAD